ncbi:MAG: cytochrome P450 [Novosphingobium sp.]
MTESLSITGKPAAPVPSHVPQDRVVDFDIFAPPGIDELGLHEAWIRLQQSTPHEVVWTPHNEGHWIALRGQRIRAMYRDPAHFSSHVIWIPKSEGENYGLVPTRLDPPEHTPFRQVLNKAIGITATKEMEPMVRAVAVRIIDELAPKGHCNFTEEYAKQFPVQVFLELLDLPVKDAEEVKKWVDQMTRPDGSMPMEEIMENFFRYVDPVIDRRLKEPGDDLISRVINNDIDGREMTRSEMRGLVSLLLVAGLDTVVNILGFFMEFLARNPDHRRQLVEDPKLIRKGIEELFRRFPVVAEARMVKVDTEVDGTQMKAGEMVCVPTLLGGTDDRMNGCPMHVDFNRKGISHVTFGDGPHICAGQHFARLEATVTLEEWLKRIPEFEIPAGESISHKSGIVCTVERLPLVWPTSRSA